MNRVLLDLFGEAYTDYRDKHSSRLNRREIAIEESEQEEENEYIIRDQK